LDEISPPVNSELPRNQSRFPPKATSEPVPRRDLYALLQEYASEDPKL
ncbi:unnamed protein product, partial [Diplocarpon coronariae]